MDDERTEADDTEIDVEEMIESHKCKRALDILDSIGSQITLIEMRLDAALISVEDTMVKEPGEEGPQCEIVARLDNVFERLLELKHRIRL